MVGLYIVRGGQVQVSLEHLPPPGLIVYAALVVLQALALPTRPQGSQSAMPRGGGDKYGATPLTIILGPAKVSRARRGVGAVSSSL